MGLRATIKQAARAGFAAAGDVAETVSYHTTVKGTYDPHAGATYGDSAGAYAVQAVCEDYSAIEVDGAAVRMSDVKALILQADLPVTPATDDRITRGTTVYRVVAIGADPAGALWNLQLRA